MSLYVLAAGALIADPQRREGAKGAFATAVIRVEAGEPTIVSAIAFGDTAERLLELAKGDAIAVSGRAQVKSWTDREGVTQRGLSIVAEQIATAKPRPGAAEAQPGAGAPSRPRRARPPNRSYPKSRPIPDLPDDRVDDLYADIAP